MAYIKGTPREQVVLFPEALDDYIDESSAVRVVWALIERLDLKELGFERAEPEETGRPGYDPRTMLAIYLWGHLNKVRSSRGLEKECKRNLELMWLTGKLTPDFKTIAKFRVDNVQAVKQTLSRFRLWCQDEGLYGGELVAVDSSKFEAVNSNRRNYNKQKLAQHLARSEAEAEQYLAELDAADQAADKETPGELTVAELKEKIERVNERLERYKKMQQELEQKGEEQVSLTDPEARLMKSGRGADVCYSVQGAVDSKHKLIVDFEISNAGADQGQLTVIAKKAKETLGVESLSVVGDAGYFDSASIKECEEAQIETYICLPDIDRGEKKGLFAREEFHYDQTQDLYVCPQGEALKLSGERTYQNGRVVKIYLTAACGQCPLKARCTSSAKGRRIERWVHEEVMERQRERNRQHPELLKQRKALIEHPWGTIKRAMGQTYFLLKGKQKVAAEFSFTVLAYNFKRVMSIMGAEKMISRLIAGIA